MSFITQFWAKTDRNDPTRWHPVAYHNLDVAAAGRALLQQYPRLLQRMGMQLGIAPATLLDWLTFLLALHDCGKYAEGFQNLCPELMERLQGRHARSDVRYNRRDGCGHDRFGFIAWHRHIWRKVLAAEREALEDDLDEHDLDEALRAWLHPVFGHHGSPVSASDDRDLSREQLTPVTTDVIDYASAVAQLLLPEGTVEAVARASCSAPLKTLRQHSWLVAGLAVLADWLGSSTTWFPFLCPEHDPVLSLEHYWKRACDQAARAVVAANLGRAPSSARAGLAELFDATWPATALQREAETLELADGPQLFVIEELTGGGKTEAALILAQRIMQRGLASGIYLALPTMATANAMFERVRAVAARLFDAEPTITLAHSGATLRDALTTLDAAAENAPRDESSARAARIWLEDSRKKALLAQLGVGTIDQALIGVLPLYHQSLRLLGLHDKVLLVDEVHACDTYVRVLLEQLLTFHAALGGSAILLSATLPHVQRTSLAAAFARGLERTPPELVCDRYPLVTHLGPSGPAVERPVEARSSVCRTVEVESLDSLEAVDARISAALERGECVCWIRNTVDDAREAFERWQARLGERAMLFHARFTVGDRARIEQEVLARFGAHSSHETRRGRLLIATQVVEQSLDLDFDVMITDLAPIDLLIQRAGRLRRHVRDALGNRLTTPDAVDARGPVRLVVHMPPAVDDPADDWFAAPFEGAAHVYPHHGRLWLGARWLAQHGRFEVPGDSRAMLEAVYGDEAEASIPPGLSARTDQALGVELVDRALALDHRLELGLGYCNDNRHWQSDARTPTRLGEPTVTLRLLRGDRPWFESGPWELSDVRVRARRVDGEFESATHQAARSTMRDEGRHVLLVSLERDAASNSWLGQATRRGQPITVRYDEQRGLQLG